jgi:hypothetical protein
MKVLFGVLATILTLSISYYFVIALPAHNRSVLDFEREKYQAAEQLKRAKADEEKDLRTIADQDLAQCTAAADAAFTDSLRANGTPNGHGGYSLPTESLALIQRQKTEALTECQRQYERATRSVR